jgi:NAD(P)H dehydrogenase (quinone)
MHTLVVFAHPKRDSYTGAVLDAFLAGLSENADDTVDVADLYSEGFDPCFQPDDYAQFRGENMPPAIAREQERVTRAEALAFVFPVWWWSFPAMLKGWIDRVFSEGWAYSFEPGISRGRLRDRPTLLLGVGGSREATYRKYGYNDAMRVQIDIGVLGYCGLRDVEMQVFYDVEQSPENRARYLIEAREIGRRFLSPTRKPRIPEMSSDRVA